MRLFTQFSSILLLFLTSALSAQSVDYTLSVESSPAVHVPGNTIYRFYVNLLDATDKFSAVYGNDEDNLVVSTPDGIFNSSVNASWSSSGINPAFVGFFPDMSEDSYATVGLDGPATGNQADPSLVEDQALSPKISEYFTTGGTYLNVSSVIGASWYVLNTASNALPDSDLRVLVMQITTPGSVSGTFSFQVLPFGVGLVDGVNVAVKVSLDFDGVGTYPVAPIDDCAGVPDGDSSLDECGVCDNDPSNNCVQDCSGEWGGTSVLDECGVCGGDDSSCSDECGVPNGDNSSCTDECGVVNGSGIADGECDCEGNVLDECGICGGAGIADGECDCEGNILDGCGVCNGDNSSCTGCSDSNACNYEGDTIDDGSCVFCGAVCDSDDSVAYTLTVESSTPVASSGTTYRFYVNMTDATDRMSAVFGNNETNLIVNTPSGAFNASTNASWSASGINPAFLSFFPEMADDTYATIGLTGPASASGIEGSSDPSVVEDPLQAVTPYFTTDGATDLFASTNIGAGWYVLNNAVNGLPDSDMRVLVLQVTTSGSISGTLNYQVFPLGVGVDESDVLISLDFDGAGTYGGSSDFSNACGCIDSSAFNYDATAEYDDGSCIDIVLGCTDMSSCNYDVEANTNDGSCLDNDECGICGGDDSSCSDECGVPNGDNSSCTDECGVVNGSGIADGECDCEGNVLDECGTCGGDGIADGECDCEGNVLDECGICGGAGIADGECDCSGNVLDECGTCGGDGIADGTCDCAGNILDECGVCGGDGIADGECDCSGNFLDECGVCGGEGIADGACDCSGNVLDECGVCNGDSSSCTGCTFTNACNFDPNALIEDDSCVFYCPGCTDPLACNYDDTVIQDDNSCTYPENGYGCDGVCVNDIDFDGVCDENEVYGCTELEACNFNMDATESNDSCEYTSCIGCMYEYACNYDSEALIADNDSCEFGTCAGCTDNLACNYNPTILEDDGSCEYCSCSDCTNGCTDIAACNYDQYAYNVESLCLFVDDCGICGGTGIAEGDCDCFGNQIDAFGICGGECLSDINENNICDDEEVMGCAYSMALNYNPEATLDIGNCEFGIINDCPSDLSGNGNVGSEDLLLFLADFDLSCDDL